jgi:predicted nucleotidyltransferase
MIYTLEEIAERIRPVAEKYKLPKVWVFGSYARGEATEESDVDILVDINWDVLTDVFAVAGIYGALDRAFEKDVDVIETETLEEPITQSRCPNLIVNLMKEKVQVYENTGY